VINNNRIAAHTKLQMTLDKDAPPETEAEKQTKQDIDVIVDLVNTPFKGEGDKFDHSYDVLNFNVVREKVEGD
jgi:hypothetical protein